MWVMKHQLINIHYTDSVPIVRHMLHKELSLFMWMHVRSNNQFNSLWPSGAIWWHRSPVQGIWKTFSASAQSMKPQFFFSFIHLKISASGRRARCVRFSDALISTNFTWLHQSYYLNQSWLIIKGHCSDNMLRGIHLNAISQKMFMNFIHKMCLKIILLQGQVS